MLSLNILKVDTLNSKNCLNVSSNVIIIITCIVTSLSSTMTSFVRKSAPMVALYWLLNFLFTYWFINEVFPTLKHNINNKLSHSHILHKTMIVYISSTANNHRFLYVTSTIDIWNSSQDKSSDTNITTRDKMYRWKRSTG